MTPKEKAKELFNKYYLLIDIKNYENTKNCALIAVDEILDAVNNLDETYLMKDDVNYWLNVKQQIELL
jgi:hypothetical protein